MAIWLDETFFQLDCSAFNMVHGWAKVAGGFLTPFFNFISLLGKGGYFFIILGVVLLLFRNTIKSGIAVLLAIAVGGIFTNVILKNAFARIRPYVNSEEYKLMWEFVGAHKEKSFSFPSGHTNVATNAIIALVLSLKNKKSAWLLVFPVLMGLSRIYLVVHYLTDVIGGLIVGGVAGLLGYLLAKALFSLLENNAEKKVIKAILEFDLIELLKKNKN